MILHINVAVPWQIAYFSPLDMCGIQLETVDNHINRLGPEAECDQKVIASRLAYHWTPGVDTF